MGLGRHRARRAGADLSIFVFDFNFPSDRARNVRRGGISLFFVIVRVDAILTRSMLGSSFVGFFRCQSSRHGT
jgi:hypothetical protein